MLNDFIMVNKVAIDRTLSRIKNNPIVLILPIIYSIIGSAVSFIINLLLINIVSSIFLGFIYPLVFAVVLSSYYKMLSDLNIFNKISTKGISNSFTQYLSGIYSVYFLLFLINYLSQGLGNLHIVILFVIFVVFNPMAETIYIRNESYTSAFMYCIEFMKENFIHWIIPLVLYLGIGYIVHIHPIFFIYSRTILDLHLGAILGLSLSSIKLNYIIFQIITAVYVVYRGALFSILNGSSLRKRNYMGGIK